MAPRSYMVPPMPDVACDDRRRGAIFGHRARLFGGILLGWVLYIGVVQLIADAAASDHDGRSPPQKSDYHGFIDDLAGVPPLARWDSISFYAVAKDGYSGTEPDSRRTPAFLPLYPLLMRWLASFLRIDFFTAGLWVSRFSLLAALILLARHARDSQPPGTAAWPAPAALRACPSAFILVSVYSESLFLALALGALTFAHRQRYGLAAACVLGASLTRIQGLALIAAVAALGYSRWRAGTRPFACFAPAAAGIAAYAAMAGYCQAAFGDPLYHFAVKREFWGQGLTAPWLTLDKAIDDTLRATAGGGLGMPYSLLQLPCACLVLFVLMILFGDARRPWPELTFVGCSLAMSLFGGALGGMPRFTLVLFPVFTVLSRLHRRPVLWHAYLIAGAMLQASLLIHYVSFRGPPP